MFEKNNPSIKQQRFLDQSLLPPSTISLVSQFTQSQRSTSSKAHLRGICPQNQARVLTIVRKFQTLSSKQTLDAVEYPRLYSNIEILE